MFQVYVGSIATHDVAFQDLNETRFRHTHTHDKTTIRNTHKLVQFHYALGLRDALKMTRFEYDFWVVELTRTSSNHIFVPDKNNKVDFNIATYIEMKMKMFLSP